MRFNKQELATLATQHSNKFEIEGILSLTERQDGFFRRTEGNKQAGIIIFDTKKPPSRRKSLSCIGGAIKVSLERWCRLRGNLLFYFKTIDPLSEPLGVIVLENCEPVIRNEIRESDGYVFFIEFKDGLKQRLAANTDAERMTWIQSIKNASYGEMQRQLEILREKIEKRKENMQDIDVDMMRLQGGKELDINDVPLCESAISCDNLLCDGHGRPPNPSVVIQVFGTNGWIKYGKTEVIERTANPQFLCSIIFRVCDGLHARSLIRFSVYDVREKISQTAICLGFAEIALGVIQDTTRLRLPLRPIQLSASTATTAHSNNSTGFITIATWAPEQEKKQLRSPAKILEPQIFGHRRSQSLPPKLGVQLFIPSHLKLGLVFINPNIRNYRFYSGFGGDISVEELMMECRLCFIIPQQLLSIWILREKELLQEISGMGELGGEWRNKQMDLLDKHLKLLKDYSQAKQNLHQYNYHRYFKKSSKKGDETLEFAPVNLHLQRMSAYNDTLKRSGVLDVITVGAFTRHSGRTKTGGLIKLLQQMKDSPSKIIDQNGVKLQTANDAVQAIKQLRKEIVEIMSQLLCLAKSKNPKGMLGLCNEMVTKTRSLLNLWEPSLVEEAFQFIENHRIVDEPDNSLMPMSPFKKITQQLGALDLKSPDLEDFATPMGPQPDLWPQIKNPNKSVQHCSGGGGGGGSSSKATNINNPKRKSPSSTDLHVITSLQKTVKSFNSGNINVINRTPSKQSKDHHQHQRNLNNVSYSLPITCNVKDVDTTNNNIICIDQEHTLQFSETHFDINGGVTSSLKSESITASPQNHRNINLTQTTSIQRFTDDNTNEIYQVNDVPNQSSILTKINDNDNNNNNNNNNRNSNNNINNNNNRNNNDDNNNINDDNNCDQEAFYTKQYNESKNEILLNSGEFDDSDYIVQNCSIVLSHNGAFLDTKIMSASPSANYYRPTEEPEPLDLTQLNIEASVMCLVSKVKFLCGRCGSPAVRLRQPKQSMNRGFKNVPPDVVTSQPISHGLSSLAADADLTSNKSIMMNQSVNNELDMENNMKKPITSTNSKDLNLALSQAVGEVTRKVKIGNKFTDGLDLSLTTDWASELRPSMRKLRQAMDGLLKTARLMHSVQRLQQDMKKTTTTLNIMYRRDICFSQALTALIASLMTKLWGTTITENYVQVLFNLGPIAYFEGLLSLYASETDMWGDMCVAIEDLSSVRFTLVRSNLQRDSKALPIPRVTGSRHSLNVLVPIPETVYCLLPTKQSTVFKVTPVFFNIGINEKATLSETLGYCREQHRSNWDNFDRLKQYHIRYKKLNLTVPDTPSKTEIMTSAQSVSDLLGLMEEALRLNSSKNVKILHLAEDICRAVQGLRLTSCKSAKDRTSMAVTLEQSRILQKEFHLSNNHLQSALNTMRSEGTRCDNVFKNIGIRKYAFYLPQVLALPQLYRPPVGHYGKAQT